MKRLTLFFLAVTSLAAQAPNPVRQTEALRATNGTPIFRVTVVSRTTKAINYHHRTGKTNIAFKGTELMPTAKGEATVDSQMGSTKIETRLEKMSAANQYGPEYMTFVLWAITPEGRPMNLGELALEGDHAKLSSTTDLASFGLIVTAEPYFAVTQPSDVVVAENFITKETTGTIQPVEAKYELLQRGQYVLDRGAYKPVKVDPKGPLQLAQAENAVYLARLMGADRYAAETFAKAEIDLKNARDFLNGKTHDRKRSETNAREAAQMAEDARIITFRKMREESLANERAEAAQREATAQEQARQSAEQARLSAEQARADQQRRAQAEAAQLSADQARVQAEQERLRAERARAEAERATSIATKEKADAEAAKAAALAQQQLAMAEADKARLAAQQEAENARNTALRAEAEKAELRARLRAQLNVILETRETQRGLIVNISDVLFDFNKYTLKPGAREKLAKVAGILLAYPGLKIQLEGHTDSVGTDEYNQTLSEKRAGAVQEYLLTQGVPANGMTAKGFGKSSPIASNDNAAGRQRNRRVDMVVSGEPIGVGTEPEPQASLKR